MLPDIYVCVWKYSHIYVRNTYVYIYTYMGKNLDLIQKIQKPVHKELYTMNLKANVDFIVS